MLPSIDRSPGNHYRVSVGKIFKAKEAFTDVATAALKIAPLIEVLINGGKLRSVAPAAVATMIDLVRRVKGWVVVLHNPREVAVFETVYSLYLSSTSLEENNYYRADPLVRDIAAELSYLSVAEIEVILTTLTARGALKRSGDRYGIVL